MKYFIGTVSKEHVSIGLRGGFCQFCHGKLWPAKKLVKGDWVIYYSPKDKFQSKEPYKKFTAIGQIVNEEPYQVEQFPGFKPFRRNIDYKKCREVNLDEVSGLLEFTKDKGYGILFRRGFFEISKADFETIFKKMLLCGNDE